MPVEWKALGSGVSRSLEALTRRHSTYDDLEVVGHWRTYLDDPMRYLRHVL